MNIHNLIIIMAILTISINSEKCFERCSCTKNDIRCVNHVPDDSIESKYDSITIIGSELMKIKRLNSDNLIGFSKMKTLVLKKLAIEQISRETFSEIKHLTNLQISHNNISVLKSEMFEGCSSMWELLLVNNQIKTIFPNTFADLGELRVLDLSDNLLTQIPERLPNGLHNLVVNFNRIVKIENFRHPNIKNLSLAHNRIESLVESRMTLENLEELYLGGINFTLVDDSFKNLKMPNLRKLSIEGEESYAVRITPLATLELNDLVQLGLRTLHLKLCRFDTPDILQLQSLEELSIKDSKFPILRTRRRLKYDLRSLEIMDMTGSREIAFLFLDGTSTIKLDSLRILKMANCDLKDVSKDLLDRAPNLVKLDISENPLNCFTDGFDWIEESGITLLRPNQTVCAEPEHLAKLPLIHALNFTQHYLLQASVSSALYLSPSGVHLLVYVIGLMLL